VFYDLTNVATASYSAVLNGAGSVDVTIQTRDALTPVPVEVLQLLRRRQKATVIIVGWVQSSGETYAVADALIDTSSWNPGTGVLTVSGESVWSLMGERMMYPMWAREVIAGGGTGTFFVDSTIEDAMWWIVAASIGLGKEIYRNGELIYAPTGNHHRHQDFRWSSSTATQSRRWEFPYRERTALEILEEFLGYDGAPDVALQPRIVDEEIYWLVHTKVDMLRWESELVHDRAPGFQSRVTDLQIVKDGVRGTTSLLKVGGGSGKSMQSTAAVFQDIGISVEDLDGLTRERITSAKQADDNPRLRRLAVAELRENYSDIEQWSFGVRCDGEVPPSLFMPGAGVRLQYGGDELYSAKEHLFQILGVSGSTDSTQLRLDIQNA
jgi:hypothetical protein